MKKYFGFLLVALIFSQPSYAVFMAGDQVRLQYLYPNTSTVFATTDSVVGSSAEAIWNIGAITDFTVDLLPGTGNIELRASQLTNSAFTGASFNGVRVFDFFSSFDTFTSASISLIEGTLDELPSVSFSENELLINFTPSGSANGYTLPFKLNVSVASGQVPEPTTLALMGLGLAGIGFARKKKQTA